MTLSSVTVDLPKSRCYRRALITLLALAWSGLSQAECAKTLRWDDDPPFSMQAADGTVVGIDIDINRAVLERLGCQATLRKLPWARALKELELGRLDILSGAFRRPERERYAYFSGVFLPPSRNILFMHQQALERWPVQELLELQHTEFRLGGQIDAAYGEQYQQLMADPLFAERAVLLSNRSGLWQMIAKGRIDGLIADEYTGVHELRQLALDHLIKPSAVVVSSAAAEVAFSKRSIAPDFVQAYAREMQVLMQDGTYQRVMQRYLQP